MALSGSRLQGQLITDFISELNAQFPVPGSLLTAEKAAYSTAQTALATALASAIGPDVVSEITGHAVVTTNDAQGGTNTGTVA